jgi:hypothetical protein
MNVQVVQKSNKMNQCLHCGKPCAENALFCDACQSRKDNSNNNNFFFAAAHASPSQDEMISASTPTPASQPGEVDPTASRLSEAARWIEEDEAGVKRLRRSARLAPLRDISSEIQRASTIHPSLQRTPTFDTQPEVKLQTDNQQRPMKFSRPDLPDLGAWLADTEEKESDLWANATDPFISRSRPDKNAAASIEAEDIRRVRVEEHPTLPYPSLHPQARRKPRSVWKMAIGLLVILALVALAVDGLLFAFSFNRTNHAISASGGPPTLALSTTIANVGDSVAIHLTHFAPETMVALTHDFQQSLLTNKNTSWLNIDASGEADALFAVSSTWGPGFHLIVAEDVTTRDTASTMLQVNGAGPSRPPHLLVDDASLNLGEGVQGTNTIQPLALLNSGGGTISWSLSSNKPWLLAVPQQGTFGVGQTISVAGQRNNLPPGDYTGTLTLSSSVGAQEQVQIDMKVIPLPPNAGPMISLTPPLLAFTTTDGASNPLTQVVTLSNPGQQMLYWSLSQGASGTTTMQSSDNLLTDQQKNLFNAETFHDDTSWLSTDQSSGELTPGHSTQIHITVRSQNLLPNTYMGTLQFNASEGKTAFDSPQDINIALTIQPHCGLVTSAAYLSFTAVDGQSNPSSHAIRLNATSSCAEQELSWQASPSQPWITVSPTSGQVKGTDSSITSIGVNITNMLPNAKYTGMVTFQAGKSTQTLMVNLDLQPKPAPSEPILGASPLALNFTTIQGQTSPGGQVVTITNNGGSALHWNTNIVPLAPDWIAASPTGGTVAPGQTALMTVSLNAQSLTPGNYASQITIEGTDTHGTTASGSPQTITVSLVVQPPCTLTQPSASSLLFNGTANGANPLGQTETFTTTGSCSWPLHWSTGATPSWLTLNAASGTISTNTQQGSIGVNVNTAGLTPGTYTAQVKISALDSTGSQVQGSPESFTVVLMVLQPCTLAQIQSPLTFNEVQGQTTSSSQTLNLNETGTCTGGVTWTATGDNGSSSWLGLSATSGTDSGNGSSIGITATAGNLAPGTYTGLITISANNNGEVLQNSPQIVTVTLNVTGYTIGGTALACGGPAPDCTSSSGLAGATVSLVNGNGVTIATVIADGSGNFTFTNIALGTYTVNVTGTSGSASYSGSTPVTVGGDTSNVSVQTFSS